MTDTRSDPCPRCGHRDFSVWLLPYGETEARCLGCDMPFTVDVVEPVRVFGETNVRPLYEACRQGPSVEALRAALAFSAPEDWKR